MKPITTPRPFSTLPKTFTGLVALHRPRPIRDEDSCDQATAICMAMAGHKLNRDQDDYLDLLATLIVLYEDETVPPPTPSTALESLRYFMTDHELTSEELGKILGVKRSNANRILQGTRKLTISHVKKLAARFAVSADLFIQ